MENKLNSLLENGWLSRLVFKSNHLEKSIAKWTYSLMLSKEELMASACEFWCSILSSRNVLINQWRCLNVYLHFLRLNNLFEIYGFLLDSSSTSSNSEMLDNAYDCVGPPQNITGWIKFVAACCQIGKSCSIFEMSWAEKLAGNIISLFPDWRIQGLSMILNKCMLSV